LSTPIEELVGALLQAIQAAESTCWSWALTPTGFVVPGFDRIQALRDAVGVLYTKDEANRSSSPV
jgi:hypothetical protein